MRIAKIIRHRGMTIIFSRNPGDCGWSWRTFIRARRGLLVKARQEYAGSLRVARRSAISIIDAHLD